MAPLPRTQRKNCCSLERPGVCGAVDVLGRVCWRGETDSRSVRSLPVPTVPALSPALTAWLPAPSRCLGLAVRLPRGCCPTAAAGWVLGSSLESGAAPKVSGCSWLCSACRKQATPAAGHHLCPFLGAQPL